MTVDCNVGGPSPALSMKTQLMLFLSPIKVLFIGGGEFWLILILHIPSWRYRWCYDHRQNPTFTGASGPQEWRNVENIARFHKNGAFGAGGFKNKCWKFKEWKIFCEKQCLKRLDATPTHLHQHTGSELLSEILTQNRPIALIQIRHYLFYIYISIYIYIYRCVYIWCIYAYIYIKFICCIYIYIYIYLYIWIYFYLGMDLYICICGYIYIYISIYIYI